MQASTAFSQKENWRITYEYTYVFDSLTQEVRNDVFLLEISPKRSSFYSRYTAENDALQTTPEGRKRANEVMAAALKEMQATGRMNSNFPHKRATVVVDFPRGADSVLVMDEIQGERFKWKNELPQWELSDSTMEQNGNMLQEAICDFHGRRWHAWFAIDYPFQDGPWCLKGLPGLIFNAYDELREHVFELTKIEAVPNSDFFHKDGGRKWIDRKKFLRELRKSLENSGFSLSAALKDVGEKTSPTGRKAKLRRDFLETDYLHE